MENDYGKMILQIQFHEKIILNKKGNIGKRKNGSFLREFFPTAEISPLKFTAQHKVKSNDS